jgi:protein involved in temperature-dependent protein secretion
VDRLRGQLAAQVVQARTYFEAGKKDFDEGSWKKAESNLYLATRYDPQNEAYQELHKKAVTIGRQARAVQYVAAAETAEPTAQAPPVPEPAAPRPAALPVPGTGR